MWVGSTTPWRPPGAPPLYERVVAPVGLLATRTVVDDHDTGARPVEIFGERRLGVTTIFVCCSCVRAEAGPSCAPAAASSVTTSSIDRVRSAELRFTAPVKTPRAASSLPC